MLVVLQHAKLSCNVCSRVRLDRQLRDRWASGRMPLLQLNDSCFSCRRLCRLESSRGSPPRASSAALLCMVPSPGVTPACGGEAQSGRAWRQECLGSGVVAASRASTAEHAKCSSPAASRATTTSSSQHLPNSPRHLHARQPTTLQHTLRWRAVVLQLLDQRRTTARCSSTSRTCCFPVPAFTRHAQVQAGQLLRPRHPCCSARQHASRLRRCCCGCVCCCCCCVGHTDVLQAGDDAWGP
ncbi:hypothetical protein COO60DRAFT_1509565 [Scenedesmus sp. NREL 46B-D3]|nr:hypothetical protein COO60DRAFT_1509565 [Scenedesmus sp. NREL 46B-D3]